MLDVVISVVEDLRIDLRRGSSESVDEVGQVWCVFGALAGKPGVTGSLTGGTREPRTDSLVGPVAARTAGSFIYDAFICSAAALDPELGSSEASLAEAEVKRAFSATSGRIVLAVDRSKLNTRAQARMFTLADVDLLVTELDPDDERLDDYRQDVELM